MNIKRRGMTKKQLKKEKGREAVSNIKREPQTFPLLPSEIILPNDYPLHYDFVYIMDGVFRRQREYTVASVFEYKFKEGVKEIRKCEIFREGREAAKLGDKAVLPQCPSCAHLQEPSFKLKIHFTDCPEGINNEIDNDRQ